MAIKVGDFIEFQTPDMSYAETSKVEQIIKTQEGNIFYVKVPSLGHYKGIYRKDITFYHPNNNIR